MKNIKGFSLIELSIVILIIGILVAGVTQSSRLINMMKIQSARSLTMTSPVSSISNLVLWYEPTLEKSFDSSEAADATEVTTWFDTNPQSSSKNNAISVGSARPKYKSNCLNGLPCLSFDGNDYLDTTQLIGGLRLSIFMVVSVANISVGTCCTTLLNSNGNWMLGKAHFQFDGTANISSTTGVVAFFANDVSTGHYSIRNGALANFPYIYSLIDKGNSVTLYINGATSGSGASVGNLNGVIKTPVTHNIGSWFDGGTRSRYLIGSIAEIIIFDRDLKIDERQDVEKYLAKKWAIKI
jgi:prepilin-type N-terminal cleavage/methylation domain-containing protein